jgi:hypothetical protein
MNNQIINWLIIADFKKVENNKASHGCRLGASEFSCSA